MKTTAKLNIFTVLVSLRKAPIPCYCRRAREVTGKSFVSLELEINFCLQAIQPSKSLGMRLTSKATFIK